MGKSSSKLKRYVKHGDEVAAIDYIRKHKLAKSAHPNDRYSEKYHTNTLMHMAAKKALPEVLSLFVEMHGDVFSANSLQQIPLHLCCMSPSTQLTHKEQKNRQTCLQILIERILQLKQSNEIKRSRYQNEPLNAADRDKNTALHYAADCGLLSCVQFLVENGASVFSENSENQTPCDLAVQNSHTEIAEYLEAKMVFCDVLSITVNDDILEEQDEGQGLEARHLLEAKDTLIVETADMLRVPLFTAEALLRHHEWSRQVLMDAWIQNARGCCEKSGVACPSNLESLPYMEHELRMEQSSANQNSGKLVTCEICYLEMGSIDEISVVLKCSHVFCTSCWKEYLHIKIQEGDAHNIICPGTECHTLVPVELIEKIVSPLMARRYLQFDIKAFVESNPNMIWCPHPGCGLALHSELPRRESISSATAHSSRDQDYITSTAVCSNGHSFCWSCQLQPHEPASCEHLKNWMDEIAEARREEFQDINMQAESAANTFWMTRNSKKCPHCKAPIEKNEGCNHMRCSKCKHDFCWVCLEPWKKHNTATGGFFRCTRYEVSEQVDTKHQSELSDAKSSHQKLQQMSRFIFFLTRFQNHEHSYQLEQPLLERAKIKMAQLLITNDQSAPNAAKFLEVAISSLLKARHVLQFSYVYGYYLKEENIRRQVFELLQSELELCVEKLSQMIARPYLRTPRSLITHEANQVSSKRDEFLIAISKSLVIVPAIADFTTDSDSSDTRRGSDWSLNDLPNTETTFLSNCRKHACERSVYNNPSNQDTHHEYCSIKCLKYDVERGRQRERASSLAQRVRASTDAAHREEGSGNGEPFAYELVLQRILSDSATNYQVSALTEELDDDLQLALQMSILSEMEQEMMMKERSELRRQRAHSQPEFPTHSLRDSIGMEHDAEPVSESQINVEPHTYESRIAELDRVIDELLNESSDIGNETSLRRVESARQQRSARMSSVVRRSGSVNQRSPRRVTHSAPSTPPNNQYENATPNSSSSK